MKGLTICQPYAWLCCLADDDPRAKRIENRVWGTNYRGPLAIHAGQSRAWLENWGGALPAEPLAFGAILATCKLIDCVRGVEATKRLHPHAGAREHYEGPWCWVLADVRPLETPRPYRGAPGLFDVDVEQWPELVRRL